MKERFEKLSGCGVKFGIRMIKKRGWVDFLPIAKRSMIKKVEFLLLSQIRDIYDIRNITKCDLIIKLGKDERKNDDWN